MGHVGLLLKNMIFEDEFEFKVMNAVQEFWAQR